MLQLRHNSTVGPVAVRIRRAVSGRLSVTTAKRSVHRFAVLPPARRLTRKRSTSPRSVSPYTAHLATALGGSIAAADAKFRRCITCRYGAHPCVPNRGHKGRLKASALTEVLTYGFFSSFFAPDPLAWIFPDRLIWGSAAQRAPNFRECPVPSR